MFTKRYLQLSKKCQDLVGCQGGILKKSVQPRQNSFIPRSSNLHTSTASGTKPSTTYQKNTQPSSHILSNRSFSGENILSSVSRREMSSATEPRVIATPRVCMHDVKTSIKVEGLSSNQPVTVRMSLTEDRGKKFCSYAHFISDKDGNVDLCTMPSLGGSYTGLVPSGLLMSLKAAPGEFKYARLLKEKIEEPLEIKLSVHASHETVEDDTKPLSEVELKRHFIRPGTRVIEVEHEKVHGVLFVPPGPGPFPGVIDMYGGAGGIIVNKAALLSSHGFATLALPFFNYKNLSKTMADIEIEYLEAATEYLTSYQNIIPDRCGILGLCQGGSLALLMASWINKVKAVVIVNSSASVYYAKVTRNGHPIFQGHVPTSGIDGMSLDKEGVLIPTMNPEDLGGEASSIAPVEEASLDTNFYFAYGEGDAFKFYKGVKFLTQRLDSVGNRNYISETYKGAGHIIEAPNIPFSNRSYQPVWPSVDPGDPTPKGIVMEWGGSIEGNGKMQEEYWPKAIQYLKYHIRDRSLWYQEWMMEAQQMRVLKYKL